jgi:hypothetical protein
VKSWRALRSPYVRLAIRPARIWAVDGLEQQRLDTLEHHSFELRGQPVVERQQSADSSYLAVAKISVLVRRLWAGLVFDDLTVVAPSNAGHLPFVAQPLRLGIALVVFVRAASSPERRAVFVCCGSCSDCSDAELERRIIERVSEPVAAA